MIYDTIESLDHYRHIFELPEVTYETIGPQGFDGRFSAHSHYATVFLVQAGSVLVCSTYPEGAVNQERDINGFIHLESSGITATAKLDPSHFLFFAPYEPYALIAEETVQVARLLVEVR